MDTLGSALDAAEQEYLASGIRLHNQDPLYTCLLQAQASRGLFAELRDTVRSHAGLDQIMEKFSVLASACSQLDGKIVVDRLVACVDVKDVLYAAADYDGNVSLHVVASNQATAERVMAMVKTFLPESEVPPNDLEVSFWMMTQ